MIVSNMDVIIDKNNVFRLMDCDKDSPVFNAVEKVYNEMMPIVKDIVRPQAAIEVGEISITDRTDIYPEGTPVIYIIYTLGSEISMFTDKLLSRGEYLKASIVNTMADQILFGIDEELQDTLKKICKQREKGIIARLEAISDFPVSIQKTAYTVVNAKEIGISITSHNMIEPVKSMCLIYPLSDNKKVLNIYHDCAKCNNKDCRMRRVMQGADDACEEKIVSVAQYDKYEGTPVYRSAILDDYKKYAIATDIGTTTIAFGLYDINEYQGVPIKTYTMLNHQRAYGADVISRIEASCSGKDDELKKSIRNDLNYGIENLIKSCNIHKNEIGDIAIGANTVMGHLLMGYSCKNLGRFPFTPVNIGTINTSGKNMGINGIDCNVTMLPGISAYVGADIAAGLLLCNFADSSDINFFIDLGTNGEMAIGNRDRIIVTSVAAGPSFEGGGISCGIGSIPGAIYSVSIDNNHKMRFKTINDEPPIGICGTGIIEIVAELFKAGIIDETGLLQKRYFEDGFVISDNGTRKIYITQKDIREVQLAKAAVRAGIEVLIKRYNADMSRISHVYLAGGFGYVLDTDKAVDIGMFPEEFSDKIKAVGNTCLGGTAQYMLQKESRSKTDTIISAAQEISLADTDSFNDYYISSMYLTRSHILC